MESPKKNIEDFVETDLQGYEEASGEHSCETEVFDFNGKKVE